MSGWVGQRTCVECGYSGPEADFMAAGIDEAGEVYLIRWDDQGPFDVLVCGGCAAALAHLDAVVVAQAVMRLVIAEYAA
jgi:hypothetical protein